MDKDTLLEKSRNESKKGDEYQLSIEKNGYCYAFWGANCFITILWILASFDLIQGSIIIGNHSFSFRSFLPSSGVLSLAIYYLYRFYYLRKKGNLFAGLFFAIGFIAFLYRFFISGMIDK